MIRTFVAAALLSVAGFGAPASPAFAADYMDVAVGPDACQDASVLGFITARFDDKAVTYLKRDIAISEIRNPGQRRLELRDETHRTEREYCHATAVTSDGQKRALWYLIERNWGFAGIGPSVEFCLSGLDPWYVYGARCASLR